MPSLKKRATITNECVACGYCVKICPKKAINIHKGIQAIANKTDCVGCGKCVKYCPAGVIVMEEVHATYEK